MLRFILKRLSWLGFLLLGISVVAQTSDCPAIVETALNSIDVACSEAGRNQACYGNVSIETQFQSDVTDMTFADVGDIVDVGAIQSMQLSALDEASGKWGLAVLKLQANIADTVPGQNVTFLLFGDVEITDASDDYPDTDLTPMQAFYLKTGIGDASCAEAPESGVVIQTPEGTTDVVFNVNGVDVAMGSTILFQAQADGEMMINAMEGSAMMELDGDIHTAIAGTRLRVPLDENFKPTGPPPLPEAYDENLINGIPHQHLERQIAPPPPLTGDQLAQAHEMIGNGQLPCGMEGFPDCEKLPTGGLRQGPMCRHEADSCSERLAPHEGKGIVPPERVGQCIGDESCQNQPPLEQPLDNAQQEERPPRADTSLSEPTPPRMEETQQEAITPPQPDNTRPTENNSTSPRDDEPSGNGDRNEGGGGRNGNNPPPRGGN